MSKILVCSQCGYTGKPKSAVKGNGGIELILWLFFLLPGLIYSTWRSSSRHSVCPKCKSDTLIPIDSPRARKLMIENGSSEAEITEALSTNEKAVDREQKSLHILIAIVVIIVIVMISMFKAIV
jgi:hypothetical protein